MKCSQRDIHSQRQQVNFWTGSQRGQVHLIFLINALTVKAEDVLNMPLENWEWKTSKRCPENNPEFGLIIRSTNGRMVGKTKWKNCTPGGRISLGHSRCVHMHTTGRTMWLYDSPLSIYTSRNYGCSNLDSWGRRKCRSKWGKTHQSISPSLQHYPAC